VSPAEISCRLSDLNHLICPTSEFREFVSSRRAKIFRFRFPKIMIIVTKSRLDKRGVRVVTNVKRDAMDADDID
jgi:hypothetical protein